MVDFLSPQERSERMSRIPSSGTVPEKNLRRALHRLGLRYRITARELPGKPDLVFPKYKAAVFVHGCFWHRHKGCGIATTPKSNTDFWNEKFLRNVSRDKRNRVALRALGWSVIVVWECDLSSRIKIEAAANAVARRIRRQVGKRLSP
jgi:DNA mismatch endonuclease (patch repair protein)